ncbi:response regulator [Bryobacter aggregatus]|uniref:response regulator n=1 Tax=Bryobacter aggregatus TaxID=360054 RepID=UPI00138DD655|nr:response regulator [Bryobacter aggregatus]
MSFTLQLAPKKPMRLARVLLADDNPTARLTLQTVLEASGYNVDAAASAAEAMEKLDTEEYSLVLSGRDLEAPDAGFRILAHANTMTYRPATAVFDSESDADVAQEPGKRPVLVSPEDLPELLGQVADLISRRARRQVRRELLVAG